MHTNVCYLCGLPYQDIRTDDHVLPKSFGGPRVGNIDYACGLCNRRKSNNIFLPKKCIEWHPGKQSIIVLMQYLENEYIHNSKNYNRVELNAMLLAIHAYKTDTDIFTMLPRWEWIIIEGRKYVFDKTVDDYVMTSSKLIRVLNVITGRSRYLDMNGVEELR